VAGQLILVGGGARSGKSRFALSLALERGRERVFVATAQAFDDEMARRIERHRDERGDGFRTVEASLDLAATLDAQANADVVLVDCLTLYLSNLLLAEPDAGAADVETRVAKNLGRALDAIGRHPGVVIIVSNEVGMGIVPVSPLGRIFRDLAGKANQLFAARADEIYLAALGVILRLRPDPLQALPPFPS
jgi:adenosylcobinamide kinase/adenosylcobinamide-phosphate guanylyltransferase